MKVLALIGSPRKGGNTETLVDRVLDGARAGAAGPVEVEKVYLQDLELRFCLGCYTCTRDRGGRPCVHQDDMHLVHAALSRCDAFVIGTPVYFFGPSAQTKVFLDRLMPFTKGGALRGKPLAVAIPYGDSEPVAAGAMNAYHTIRDAAAYLGIDLVGWVHGTGPGRGEIARDRRVMDQAWDLGKKLAGRKDYSS